MKLGLTAIHQSYLIGHYILGLSATVYFTGLLESCLFIVKTTQTISFAFKSDRVCLTEETLTDSKHGYASRIHKPFGIRLFIDL